MQNVTLLKGSIMRNFCLPLFLMSSLLSTNSAFAHTRWKLGSTLSPPRNNSTGLKTAPCGGVARSASLKNYSPGQSIPVEFEETINHPGRFEIRILGPQDQPISGFTEPLLTIQDTQNTQVSNGINHQYTAQVPLPNITCIDCTLQLIQVMTENPAAPSFYYSCSDISVGATAPEKPVGLKLEKRN